MRYAGPEGPFNHKPIEAYFLMIYDTRNIVKTTKEHVSIFEDKETFLEEQVVFLVQKKKNQKQE